MANQGLDIAPPPRKKAAVTTATEDKPRPAKSTKFDKIAEGDKVQFNRYVRRQVAEGYEILAVKSRRKVPDLLAEGLELLEEKYGKV